MVKEEVKSVDTKSTPPKSYIQEKYESFWLYPETHPWRLAQHIAVRGVFSGATMGLIGGSVFAFVKRRDGFLKSVGKITLRSAGIGGLLLGAVAAERCYRLDTVGVEDRAYRIAYNWGQTKWDWLALDGAILGGYLLRRPFGGVLRGAGVGIGLATLSCAGAMIFNKLIV